MQLTDSFNDLLQEMKLPLFSSAALNLIFKKQEFYPTNMGSSACAYRKQCFVINIGYQCYTDNALIYHETLFTHCQEYS